MIEQECTLSFGEWPWQEISPARQADQAEATLYPRISIVTPSFNQGRYLEETIRSVLLQNYPNLEYIIMDGGSTDDSVDIIREYEAHLTYWESCPDRGQGHAINKGFARSTGEIMAWLNSDDVYTPGALHRVADALAAKRQAMLVGYSIITDGPNRLAGRYDLRRPSKPGMYYGTRTYPQPSVFWSRDLWQMTGLIDENKYIAIDYDLWLRMMSNGGVVLALDEILSIARTHAKQKTSRQVDRSLLAREQAESGLRSAHLRGEPGTIWLTKVWMSRWRDALMQRKYFMSKGSLYHRAAIRAFLSSRQIATITNHNKFPLRNEKSS